MIITQGQSPFGGQTLRANSICAGKDVFTDGAVRVLFKERAELAIRFSSMLNPVNILILYPFSHNGVRFIYLYLKNNSDPIS